MPHDLECMAVVKTSILQWTHLMYNLHKVLRGTIQWLRAHARVQNQNNTQVKFKILKFSVFNRDFYAEILEESRHNEEHV